MWSSITTALANRNLLWVGLFLVLTVACLTSIGAAQGTGLRAPSTATAGTAVSIATFGSGDATLYLLGPGHTSKQKVRLGEAISVGSDQIRAAGRYLAILCSGTCQSAFFYVSPAGPASMSFLVHPSRVAVKQPGAISGVAFPYDKFHNLIVAPITIDFQLKSNGSDSVARPTTTQHGVAWFRANSGNRAGTAQISASVGDLSVRRVVQQVASDPCNLRIKAQRTAKSILVETEPVRDCSGNAVPDGTIVTFTATDPIGKSTVDMPVKQGVARAQLTASGSTVISVASGVVMGNHIRLGAQ